MCVMGVKIIFKLINVIECTHYMFIPFSKINKLEKTCIDKISKRSGSDLKH